MKLLAKTAEERYQTAAGLEADLRRCLAEWESQGRIDPFPLGAHDVSDRLLIPEKLYGREREIDALLAAFDRVVARAPPELVLVSGYSGIGKSSVVNELHKALVPPRGLFASGKFDQYKRDIPYATLAQAFQSLVRQILGKSEASWPWRDALEEALGPNGQLIVNLIPEVELIIGKQPPVPDLPPQEAQNRFQMVFRRFLGVFARPEHPLALFLDDLQWLDAATLDLLEHLLTTGGAAPAAGRRLPGQRGRPAHPLMRTLERSAKPERGPGDRAGAPRARRPRPARRRCPALRAGARAAAGAAGAREDRRQSVLRDPVPHALAEEGCSPSTMMRRAGMGPRSHSRQGLHRQRGGPHGREAEAGCRRRRRTALAAARLPRQRRRDRHPGDRSREIEEADPRGALGGVRAGLIERLEGAYKFLHDRVQEAAYSLIPEGARAEAHLRIGRLLAAHTPPEKREEAIFEIVNQLNRGAALITAREEREQVAELNLIAGKRAKASTAYASALTYLIAGAALLAEDWERRHELIFALELHRAECEFLTGELAAAEERLAALSTARRKRSNEPPSRACA
jgi:hypothetical protein